MGRECPVCGCVVEGRLGKIYCSRRCRDWVYYEANREKRCRQSRLYNSANKERIAERDKVYREVNKVKIAERTKAYYNANREKILKKNRAYCEANKEKVAEYRKEYREINKEKRAEQGKAYREANREKIAERMKAYRRANRERIAAYREGNRERVAAYREANKEKIAEQYKAWYRRSIGLPEDWDLSRESSIEVLMRLWLIEFMIEFETQKRIDLKIVGGTCTVADFFIPEIRVCLFCDGDYWHSKEGIPERDTRITEALEQLGYVVIRVSGTDIRAGQWPIEILEMLA